MGFLIGRLHREQAPTKGVSLDLLHRHECQVCPLNLVRDLLHPKMAPNGSEKPLVYMLGEAPGEVEDEYGEAFIGPSGKCLRQYIDNDWLKYLRWSNTIRCRPTKKEKKDKGGYYIANRDPTEVETECCRPKLVRDIEASKPAAIFGFGGVALHWMIGEGGVTHWRGRRLPVKIGKHTCWYYPMFHPSYILQMREEPRGRDIEFTFGKDLERAFAEVDAGLPQPVVHDGEMARADVEIITGEYGDADVERILAFLDQCRDVEAVGFDYETKRKRPYGDDAKLLTIAMSNETRSLAFALDHPQAKWKQRQRERIVDGYRDFLHTSSEARKISHHLAFELEWTAHLFGNDIIYKNRWGDTISQAFILDERQGTLSLEFLCWQHFGLNVKMLSPAFDKDNLDKEELADVLTYNAIDAKYHRLLYHAQKHELQRHGLIEVYAHHIRRVQATVVTQLKGIPVDQDIVAEFYKEYSDKLADVEERIAALPEVKSYNRSHTEFRPSAPADLKAIVKQEHGIILDVTKEAVLEEHAGIPIIDRVLEWRGINKLRSTYVKPCLTVATAAKIGIEDFTVEDSVVHPDGLMHPIISTVKTRTWRTSAEEPNEQNFPKHENRQVRRMVRSQNAKRKVVSFDYAGIQARNIAMESRDPALVKAFWERYDIHSDWMERIERRVPGWIKMTAEHDKKYWRNRAKNGFVFPSFFGAQPKKTSSELGIDIRYSELLYDDLWEMFPNVLDWQKSVKSGYHKHGYVTGLSGFRRRAPVSPNELINAPIQADEAIIVLTAMSELAEMEDPRLVAAMEIHDDLTFIWHQDEIERNAETVIDVMLNTPYEWAHVVPIGVEMAVGDDWESVKGVGEYYSDQWTGRMPKQEKKVA